MRIVAGLAAVASAAAAAASVPAGGQVTALDAAGASVAWAATARGCVRIGLWRKDVRGLTTLARRCFVGTSTGSGVTTVSVAGERVAWLEYTGGNIREWSLYTASVYARKPRLLQFQPRDVDEPSPIVLGAAFESLLPYAVGRTVVVLRPDGSRRYSWTAPARVVALAAGAQRVGALLENGHLVVLSPNGAVEREHRFARGVVKSFSVGSTRTVIGFEAGVFNGGRELRVPRGARLAGHYGDVAAYVHRGQVRGLRLTDGRDVLLARGTFARFGRRGLAYASGVTVSHRAAPLVAAAFLP